MNKKCNCLQNKGDWEEGKGVARGWGTRLQGPCMLISKCPYGTQSHVQLIFANEFLNCIYISAFGEGAVCLPCVVAAVSGGGGQKTTLRLRSLD